MLQVLLALWHRNANHSTWIFFRLLRLEFDHSHLEYYTELDAVLLVGTKEPIVSPETQQVPSYDLIVPNVGKLTSQILQLNIHNIPPQVVFTHMLRVFHDNFWHFYTCISSRQEMFVLLRVHRLYSGAANKTNLIHCWR
jgi:hypothetical protein